jgi:hypothetical protein
MQSVFLLADDAAQVDAGPPRNPKAGRGSKSTGRGAAAAGRSSQQGDRKQSSVWLGSQISYWRLARHPRNSCFRSHYCRLLLL